MRTYNAINILRGAGYQVVQRTNFHIQILLDDKTINIWPTANKILRQFETGPAKRYSNLLRAVEKEIKGYIYTVTPLLPEMEWIMWWRSNPIKHLDEYVASI